MTYFNGTQLRADSNLGTTSMKTIIIEIIDVPKQAFYDIFKDEYMHLFAGRWI